MEPQNQFCTEDEKKPPGQRRKNVLLGQRKEEVNNENRKNWEKNEAASRGRMWESLSRMLWGPGLSLRMLPGAQLRAGRYPGVPASLFSRRGNI